MVRSFRGKRPGNEALSALCGRKAAPFPVRQRRVPRAGGRRALLRPELRCSAVPAAPGGMASGESEFRPCVSSEKRAESAWRKAPGGGSSGHSPEGGGGGQSSLASGLEIFLPLPGKGSVQEETAFPSQAMVLPRWFMFSMASLSWATSPGMVPNPRFQ